MAEPSEDSLESTSRSPPSARPRSRPASSCPQPVGSRPTHRRSISARRAELERARLELELGHAAEAAPALDQIVKTLADQATANAEVSLLSIRARRARRSACRVGPRLRDRSEAVRRAADPSRTRPACRARPHAQRAITVSHFATSAGSTLRSARFAAHRRRVRRRLRRAESRPRPRGRGPERRRPHQAPLAGGDPRSPRSDRARWASRGPWFAGGLAQVTKPWGRKSLPPTAEGFRPKWLELGAGRGPGAERLDGAAPPRSRSSPIG